MSITLNNARNDLMTLLHRWLVCAAAVVGIGLLAGAADVVRAQEKKPNILVIFGDDIGILNVSAYGRGVIGYTTPNIDRIAREGAIFTDYYGQQSCTAGRSAFLTGQVPFRTGLSKVRLPGAPQGLQKEDPTIAELLKPQGYVTGQFGKNHLGDRDEFLPTAHGFDEFFGNLYHLNAEEEPENEDYPKHPEFRTKFGPRGVIKSTADGKIEDTGPLTRKRMETIDTEVLGRYHRLHRPRQESEQAVLRLVQHHPHAQLHACATGEPQDRGGGVCRWHDRARRPHRTAP
jgi:arylsulfatase A-like enzyme